MKRSFKTTTGGVLAAVGILATVATRFCEGEGLTAGDTANVIEAIGWILAALGIGTVGAAARDDDVSSEGTVAPKKAKDAPK
jgi:hypothetical protein